MDTRQVYPIPIRETGNEKSIFIQNNPIEENRSKRKMAGVQIHRNLRTTANN